jgi:hypothetical protein
MIKLRLLFLAIIGTLLGYYITDLFIVNIALWQFIIIELVISIFHEIYNVGKGRITNVNPE